MITDKNLLYKIKDKSIYSYKLTNSKGLTVTISNYGASILSIAFKNSCGKLQNLALGFKNFETYLENSLYAGATLGPNAGRLEKGSLPLGNKIYSLCTNENSNNLHGGYNNVSFQIWTYEGLVLEENSLSLTLSLNIPHGVDGFPGNRRVLATFILTEDNELKILYEGSCDMDTYLNLSNHCYFNLSGDFTTSALDEKLTLEASEYLENNLNHCAYKLSSVDNSPFDFRRPKTLKSCMDTYPKDPQLQLGKGYNNGFILNPNLNCTKPALILESPKEDIMLKLYTNAPAIVLYSGGYIEEGLLLNTDSLSKANCALAIEPQDYPNGPNLPFVKTKFLSKDEKYERYIIYKFSFPL